VNEQQIALLIIGISLLSLVFAVVVVSFPEPRTITDKDRPPPRPVDPALLVQAEARTNEVFGLD
jgi:hypothetical protein